jgi:N-acetylglucosamine-6-phosphate deacetylase
MMNSILFKNVSLFVPKSLGPGSVLVEGGRIAAVYRIGERTPRLQALDLGGAALGPGLIDVHTHGANGVDLMDGGDAVVHMARFFARHGVTGFVPATVTASFESIEKAVQAVRCAMDVRDSGAFILGLHLEGPFISTQRLGAQSGDHCILPDSDSVQRLLEIAGDLAKIVTLAPEIEGAMAAIQVLAKQGIVVSIGHTTATAEQAGRAFDRGARQVTHMFNGMPPLHHRSPGVVGAALTTRGVVIELIADGVHLAPTTVRLAVNAKGVNEVLLVTDSMAATGCADGEYVLGPMKVIVQKGVARLESGALASSTLTMEQAVVNVSRWTDVGLGGAWQMASLNPAGQLGIADRVGRIAEGYDADLTAIDASGKVILTMAKGRVIYQA